MCVCVFLSAALHILYIVLFTILYKLDQRSDTALRQNFRDRMKILVRSSMERSGQISSADVNELLRNHLKSFRGVGRIADEGAVQSDPSAMASRRGSMFADIARR